MAPNFKSAANVLEPNRNAGVLEEAIIGRRWGREMASIPAAKVVATGSEARNIGEFENIRFIFGVLDAIARFR